MTILEINGRVIPGLEDDIAVTLQAFSFSQLGTRKGAYSNTFELPSTNEIKEALSSAQLVTSTTRAPYQENRFRIIDSGAVLLEGTALITNVARTYRVSLSAGNSDFFNALKGLALTEVDLTEYDHAQTEENVFELRESREGFVYPNIDYGFFEYAEYAPEGVVNFRFMQASFWARTILDKAIEQIGYTLEGAILGTEVWEGLSVQCKGVLGESSSGLVRYRQTFDYGTLNAPDSILVSFSERVTDVSELYTFDPNPQQFTYRPIIADAETTGFTVSISGKVITNDPRNYTLAVVTITIVIYDDLGNVLLERSAPQQRFEDRFFGPFNVYRAPSSGVLERGISASFFQGGLPTSVVTAVGGDLTRLRFGWKFSANRPGSGMQRLRFENMEFEISQVSTNSRGGILPQLANQVRAAEVLPDSVSVSDLLLLVANAEGLLISADEQTKTVRTFRLDDVIRNRGRARDWSQLLDMSEEPSINFSLPGFAQRNVFAFRGDDKDPFLPANFGRGSVVIDDANLRAENPVFVSAFSPVPVGLSFRGKFAMGRIFTGDKYSFNGVEFDLNPEATIQDFAPRVAMLTEGPQTIKISEDFDNEINFEVNASALSFERWLADNWNLLRSVTENTKVVRALFVLDKVGLSDFDFTIPVFVEKFGEFFYVQQIEQIKFNRRESCYVTLVRI